MSAVSSISSSAPTESQILRLDDRHQSKWKVSALFSHTHSITTRKVELRKCLILSGNGNRNFGIRVSHILFIRTMQDLLTAKRLKFFLFRFRTKTRPGFESSLSVSPKLIFNSLWKLLTAYESLPVPADISLLMKFPDTLSVWAVYKNFIVQCMFNLLGLCWDRTFGVLTQGLTIAT